MRVSWSAPSVCNGELLVTGCADGGARIFKKTDESVVNSKPVHILEHGDRNEVNFLSCPLSLSLSLSLLSLVLVACRYDNKSDKKASFSAKLVCQHIAHVFLLFFFFSLCGLVGLGVCLLLC
jgi:hypothetical protein